MSKSRMQNLILEVLNAQPSLRDSKQYINSFGPKTSQHPSAAAAANSRAIFRGKQQAPNIARSTPAPSTAALPPHSHQHLQHPTNTQGDSHAYPDSQIASTSKTKILGNSEADATPKDGTQEYLETNTHPIQQHTALVKVQGPFSRRQLESIADGMVYLKKLGLVSVIVVDGEEWSQPGWASEFGPDGVRIDGIEEQEDKELAPWAGKEAAEARRAVTKELNRRRRVSLRRTMFNDVNALAELLQERGAPARPFLGPLFRVDAQAAEEAERLAPRHFPGSDGDESYNSSTTAAGVAMHDKAHQEHDTHQMHSHAAAFERRQCTHSSAFGYRQMKASPTRSPLISDDNLATLRAALATDHIPIIAPLALYADPEEGYAEKSTPVKADDVLVALARDMAIAGKEAEEAQLQEGDATFTDWAGDVADVDMTPLRLMVINREGGIPSHARGGNPHLAINLASEYSHILHSFVWTGSHPTGLTNLQMVHDCLSYMPHTSSGIVVSHRSPRSLIANLITNKAAHSPSLPHSLLANRKDVRHTPTIIRPGLSINVIEDFSKVDRAKLTMLLESSFRKKLDEEAYYARLEEKCDFVIVTGDYQGAAIVTRESAPGDGPDDEPIAYLDKFAVLPSLQGSGTVDFLWGALRDEVQGLGLLDALNDNGGKGGFGKGRDLVWKSRADNPVNRWYYERSNGFVKVDTTPPELRPSKSEEELARGRNWVLFWCDAEERLSRMSGERRLRASATAEDVLSSIDDAAAANFVDWDMDAESEAAMDDVGAHAHESATGGGAAPSSPADGYDCPSSSHRRMALSAAARARAQPQSRARALPLYYDSSRLQELDPRPGGGAGQRLLPVIAPEESGRLERWARCMMYIPSAWK